jgi:hypothetical protein
MAFILLCMHGKFKCFFQPIFPILKKIKVGLWDPLLCVCACLQKLVVPYITLWTVIPKEMEQRSRYSDWLQAGQPRSQSLSPDRVKNFLFSTLSRPAPGPTQPLI